MREVSHSNYDDDDDYDVVTRRRDLQNKDVGSRRRHGADVQLASLSPP